MNETNRSVLLVTPKQPMIQWAKQNPDVYEGKIDGLQKKLTTAFLVDYDEETDIDSYSDQVVRENFRKMFVHVLDSWCVDPETWPKLDLKTFKEWFEIQYVEEAWDLGDMPFESEPYYHDEDLADEEL